MEWILSKLNGDDGMALQLVLISLALVICLVLIFWIFRRFTNTPARRAGRNRIPRLSITDVTLVDDKRFLVLARRDNVEHLLLIGGPTDVVVETGIVRTQTSKLPTSNTISTQETSVNQDVSNDNSGVEIKSEEHDKSSTATSVVSGTTAAIAGTGAVLSTALSGDNQDELSGHSPESQSEAEVQTPAPTPLSPENNEQPIGDIHTSSPPSSQQDGQILLQDETPTTPPPLQEAPPMEQPATETMPEIDLEAEISEKLDGLLLDESISPNIDDSEVQSSSSTPAPIAVETMDDSKPEHASDEQGDIEDEMQKLLNELSSETKEPTLT